MENTLFVDVISSEKNVLRCPICHLIPYIYYDKTDDSMEYKCQNNHSEKGNINIIYKKLKSTDILNIKCYECNNISTKYCKNCFTFLCNKCYINESKNCNDQAHYIIDIKNMDKICFIHNEPNTIYCNNDKKTYCDYCQHKNHSIINLRDLILSNSKLDEYKNIISQLYKFNNEPILKLLNKLELVLNNFIKKIENIKQNYNNNTYILFLSDLILSYEYKFNNKCLNYNNINNVNININNVKNNNQIDNKGFLLLLKDIKNQINNLNTESLNKKISINLNNFSNFKTFKSNKDDVHIILKLNDNRIASSFHNSKLFVFNSETFEKEIEIKEHNNEINNITQLKNNILITCSLDHTVNFIILNKDNTYEIIQKYKGKKNDIIGKFIELNNGKLASGNLDIRSNEIKIWVNDCNQYEIEKKIKLKDKKSVNDLLEIKEDIIVIDQSFMNEKNNFISFLNLKTYKKIKDIDIEFINYYSSINKFLLLNNDILLISGLKGYFYFINLNNYDLIYKIQTENKKDNHSLFKLNDNLFISSSYEYIYLYIFDELESEDNNKLKLNDKLKVHENNWITGITLTKQKEKNIIVTSDQTVKFWN